MPEPSQPFYSLIAACAPFERAPVLAVAVSGGADSMALLLIADAWAKSQGGRAIALTVDHGLRKESADEARQVKKWCDAKNIAHHTLTWIHSPPPVGGRMGGGQSCSNADAVPYAPPPRPSPYGGGSLQAAAREARYRLLADWCKKSHVLHLLTAHHRDDQAETLLFRLGRGSGLAGLACMQAVSQLHGIRLIRPLLTVPKSQLKTLLMESGQPWIEDPGNVNPKYTRNRVRAPPWVNPYRRRRQISHTGSANSASKTERRLATVLPYIISIFPDHAKLHLERLMALPPQDGLHALVALIMTLDNRITPPRTEKLQRLYADLPTFRRQRSFGNLMFIRAKQGGLLVKPLETAASAPHITPKRLPAKPLAGAPFFVMNGYSAPKEGAHALYA